MHMVTCLCCFNTQPPEGGWRRSAVSSRSITVSTHSRLKAAGDLESNYTANRSGFNTQPPEGGWLTDDGLEGMSRVFQHTAA